MTKVQRADVMLSWARFWQHEANWKDNYAGRPRVGKVDTLGFAPSEEWSMDAWVSCAVSEVYALGFEIEGAEVWDRETKTWRQS